jgi:beta-glucosidase
MTHSPAPGTTERAVPDGGHRVRDVRELADHVLEQLTLDEKISLLYSYHPPIPRLGLPAFHTGGEVLHGIVTKTPGTVFPQAVGIGATWDPGLVERIGDVIGSEADSLLRVDHAHPEMSRNVWSPVVNLLRDPRWGRNEEGYSEDPLLTSALAVAFCAGLRGAGPGEQPARWRFVPTLKHFIAYNHETDKFAVSMDLRPRVLHEYDLVPFLEPVKAGVAAAVMPSYHMLNGRPNHLSEHLRLLRAHNPDLAVISDGFAPSDIIEKSRYFEDREHAYPAAMRAGLDSFTDHWTDPTITVGALRNAVARGLLTEEEVDASARRMLLLRALAGDLDPQPVPDTPCTLGAPAHRDLAREAVRRSVVLLRNDGALPLPDVPDRRIAVIGPMADRCARDWYGGPLPYRVTPVDGIRARSRGTVVHESGLDRIALRHSGDGRRLTVGDDGKIRLTTADDDTVAFEVFDWGEGGISLRSVANGRFLSRDRGERRAEGRHEILRCDREEPYGWEIEQTFRLERGTSDGSWSLRNVYSGRYAALDTSADDDSEVDLTAADSGSALPLEAEVISRGVDTAVRVAREADDVLVMVGTHPQINGSEGRDRTDFGLPSGQSELVTAVLDAHPRTAVVLVSGHPLSVPELAGHAPALLWTSHGGQEFGNGLADLLFGDHAPTGRLPQTWYRSADDLGHIHDYDIIKYRLTYLYSDREPLFPFGHGLGYTTFRYTAPMADTPTAEPDDVVTVRAGITNTGDRAGEEVAQLYVRALDAPVPRPLRQLHGFRRVSLAPGETGHVEFRLAVRELAHWDVGRRRFTVAPGRYELMVAPHATAGTAAAVLTVTADPPPPRDLASALVRAVDFDDYHAVRLIDSSPTTGEAVAGREPGAWLLFQDVQCGPEHTGMVLRLGGAEQETDRGGAPARVEIRVDDPLQGALLGAVDVPADTNGHYDWRTVTVPLLPVDGRRDLYLVFTGPVRLASLGLTAADPGAGRPTEAIR